MTETLTRASKVDCLHLYGDGITNRSEILPALNVPDRKLEYVLAAIVGEPPQA